MERLRERSGGRLLGHERERSALAHAAAPDRERDGQPPLHLGEDQRPRRERARPLGSDPVRLGDLARVELAQRADRGTQLVLTQRAPRDPAQSPGTAADRERPLGQW